MPVKADAKEQQLETAMMAAALFLILVLILRLLVVVFALMIDIIVSFACTRRVWLVAGGRIAFTFYETGCQIKIRRRA